MGKGAQEMRRRQQAAKAGAAVEAPSGEKRARIFWDYYLLGDGSISKAGRKAKAGRERIWTSSRRLADQLQEIAQEMGYSAAVVMSQPKGDSVLHDGRVIREERKRTRYAVGLRQSRKALFRVERMPYCGPVYWVSVPNEVIYVRRNGKAAWCGNLIKPLLNASEPE